MSDGIDSTGSQGKFLRAMVGLPGWVLAFLWGFAEGTLFFVVPDVVISLVALVEPRRAWRHIAASIAGALAGGALLLQWAARDAVAAQRTVAGVPFVTSRMFDHVEASYRLHGIAAVYLGPLSGIPYKIYAIEAPHFVSRGAFLLATIPARGERFLLVWLVFGTAGVLLRRSGWKTSSLVKLYGAVWGVFYSLYWGHIAVG